MTTHPYQFDPQFSRAAVQIISASDRMNQDLLEHLDPAAWSAKPPGKTRTIAAIFTHIHNVRAKWVRLSAPTCRCPHSSTVRAVRRNRPAWPWPRAAPAVPKCSPKPSVLAAALKSFTATAGRGLGRLAWKWWATCWPTKPTIAGRSVCLPISSAFPCRMSWPTDSGIGRSYGKTVARGLEKGFQGVGEKSFSVPPRRVQNWINDSMRDALHYRVWLRNGSMCTSPCASSAPVFSL